MAAGGDWHHAIRPAKTKETLLKTQKMRKLLFTLGICLALVALSTLALNAGPSAAQQADKEPEVLSPLGKKLYAAPAEGEELAKLQAVLEKAARDVEANPASVEAIIAYGRALGGLWRFQEAIDVYTRGIASHPDEAMLYRHRGHRYISIREFRKASSDLAKAAALNDKDFDIWYHLGLAHYLLGEFDQARAAYESCLKVAADDDSKIAISNWLYATLRRIDRKDDAAGVLAGISETMKAKENTSYLNLLLFFKGLKTEDEILSLMADSELDAATVGYGVGCWHLYGGQKEKARGFFEQIVAGRYWPAFGFIAAEAELARMK
jgi:tetratricopeptide (TPR) repeat protein